MFLGLNQFMTLFGFVYGSHFISFEQFTCFRAGAILSV